MPGIPFIKIKNLTCDSGISFDNVSYISIDDHEEFCKKTKPEKGDLLITKDGTIGIVRIIEIDIEFEKTIPTVLTTSQKLSTGVDARNIRNIVLMRPVNQIIEFKQIVGRGTRLFDGK
ncbi:MAG: hypothetical protein QM498_02335 [Desulfobacterium sp.]